MSDSPLPPVPKAEFAAPEPSAPSASVPVGPTARAPVPEVATTYHYHQSVDQTMEPSDFPRLTSLIRTLAPAAGTAREFGGGLLWEHDSGYSAVSLTIVPEPGATVIRADLHLETRQFAYFGSAAAGAILAGLFAGKFLPGWEALGVTLGLLVPFTVAAWALWRASARRSATALRALVDDIAAAMRGDLE